MAEFARPGCQVLKLVVVDANGGSALASADVIVLGTAGKTVGHVWWKYQVGDNSKLTFDPALVSAYLSIVNVLLRAFGSDGNAAARGSQRSSWRSIWQKNDDRR